jgi:general secretion pathway protein K
MNHSAVGNNTSSERGVVLVLVLWMLALLTLTAAGYARSTRTETLLAAYQLQSAQARATAEGGIWLAVRDLIRPAAERDWNTAGAPRKVSIGVHFAEVSVQDEAGKIDLNSAREDILAGLLRSTGIDGTQADAVRDAILDWRDRDDLRRDQGAEDEDYRAGGYDWGAKDGPFNSVEELRLVAGMTEALYRKIAPALTVHSHRSTIDQAVAVREALLALPDVTAADVEDRIAARADAEDPKGSGRVFTITSHGLAGDAVVRVDAVVLIRRGADVPYSVLSWSEGRQEETPAKERAAP